VSTLKNFKWQISGAFFLAIGLMGAGALAAFAISQKSFSHVAFLSLTFGSLAIGNILIGIGNLLQEKTLQLSSHSLFPFSVLNFVSAVFCLLMLAVFLISRG